MMESLGYGFTKTKALTRLEFNNAMYDISLSTNYEVDVDKVAMLYSSMLTLPLAIKILLNDDSQ